MILFNFQNINWTFKKIHISLGEVDDKWFFNTFQNINQIFKKIHTFSGQENHKWLFHTFKISTSGKVIIIEIL